MTQVINWFGDSGDGVCIGGGDPKDTNHTPLKPMTFTIFKKSIDEKLKANYQQKIDYKKLAYDYELAFKSKELPELLFSLKEIQKRNSDLVFEGTSEYDWAENEGYSRFVVLDGYINPHTGMPANLFVDTGGGGDSVRTGDGNDIVYLGVNEDLGQLWSTSIVNTNGGNDRVYGSGNYEYIYLGEGDDKAYASFGKDVVEGEAGDDTIDGGEGDDTLHGDGFDAYTRNDIYYVYENRRDVGNDRLLGKGGNDFINGMGGDDLLSGGNGYDLVVGGDGSDTFVVDLANVGHDWILDFNDIGDKLVVKNNGRDAAEGEWMIRAGTIRLTDEYIDNIAQHGATDGPRGNGELYKIDDTVEFASLQIINTETNHIAASISVNALGLELDRDAINVRTTANTLEYTHPTTRSFIFEF